MTEVWKSIPGYEGLYEASSYGRIRSIDRVVTTFNANANRPAPLRRKGRILALNTGPHGYVLACLSKDGVAKTSRVNVLVCSAFNGQRPDGMQACHNDGVKTNNASDNLRWATAKANQADRISHGTTVKGSQVGTSHLTEDDIRAIRSSKKRAELPASIKVSHTHYYRIKNGQSWAHIPLTETIRGGFYEEAAA